MSFIAGEMIEGFVVSGMFELFRQISPDKALQEERRYNDAMIALEKRRVEWNEEQDRRRNRIDDYLLNKSEARENEADTMRRLAGLRRKYDEHERDRPTSTYQPSRDFTNFRNMVILTAGVGAGVGILALSRNR